ncbi:MAG TPA: NAD-dependent malic enzyme [Myxococcaceae bacterium]|nr:NAD-dependent malic enzyme [Myxococcaceae bacterium]
MGAMLEHSEGRPTSRHFDCRHDEQGREIVEAYVDGMALLRLVLVNKGTAFTGEERRQLCLDGLLPPRVNTLEQQVERAYQLYRGAPTPLDKYQFLRSLQERTEILFYALLTRHLGEMLPIVYTPTVGEAVKRFSSLYQSPRGLQLSPLNVGRVSEILRHYPLNDVRMIVATDSSAILGIGDQGYGGLGIPIGKLALYTGAGGVSPFHTMPVVLDVGTERQDLIDDPMYLGVPQRRLKGDAYIAFLDQFVAAVKERWPAAIIQWEDLSKDTAFTVLERYRKQVPSFNDDIQGTGAVTLAGVLQACRIKGERLADQRIVIHGAGAGGAGVAWAMIEGLVRDGVPLERARAQVMVLDSKGLLTTAREMEPYKRVYAHHQEQVKEWSRSGGIPSLVETIRGAKATVLLGLSGVGGSFDEQVVRAIAENTERPIIFALSNPTTNCEADPRDLVRWTDGRALVAAGSPYPEVVHGDKTYPVGQGNNAFVFPGLGFGSVLAGAREVTDGMVLEAAYALSDYIQERHGGDGRIYPPVEKLQEASIHVAARVLARAHADGVATNPKPEDAAARVRAYFWTPHYVPVVRGEAPPTETGCNDGSSEVVS